MSSTNTATEKGNIFLHSCLYWGLGGVFLGLVEGAANIPLYSLGLNQPEKFLWGPLYYGLAGLSTGMVFGALCLLWNSLRQNKPLEEKFAAAAAVALLVFAFYLAEDFSWSSKFYLSLTKATFAFLIYWLGRLSYNYLFRRQVFVPYLALSITAFTFTVFFLHGWASYGTSGAEALKYHLATLAGAVLLGVALYFFFRFFFNHGGVLYALTAAMVLFCIVLVSLGVIFDGRDTGGENTKVAPEIPILNKKELLSRKKPNILFLSPDTLRADRLSCYGYQKIKTPHIDSLAAQGVLFKKTISATSWTLPSFGSIFTSFYPSVHGARKTEKGRMNKLNDGVITLAEILHEIGYYTHAIVYNIFLGEEHGYTRGFDVHYNMGIKTGAPKKAFLWEKLPAVEDFRQLKQKNWTLMNTELALEWIDSYDQNKPFFLWLHYIDPHVPYERYKQYNLDKYYNGPYKNRKMEDLTENARTGKYRFNQDDRNFLNSLYDEEVMWLDENIGRVLNSMKNKGMLDDTIIVFVSDHGEELWDHGSFEHAHTLYTELVHVPFVITYPPQLSQGTSVNGQVRTIDIMPTLLEMLGVEFDRKVTGRSLLPVIAGKEKGDRVAFCENLMYFEDRKAFSDGKHKLIYFPDSKIYELYDLETDPLEQINIAARFPELRDNMTARLSAWMEKTTQMAQQLSEGKAPEEAVLDDEARKQLRALGYIQ